MGIVLILNKSLRKGISNETKYSIKQLSIRFCILFTNGHSDSLNHISIIAKTN